MTPMIAPFLLAAAIASSNPIQRQTDHADNQARQPNQANQQVTPTQPTINQVINTQPESQPPHPGQSKKQQFFDKALTEPLAGITVLLALIAIIQVSVYLAMHSTTKRVERAYVYVNAITSFEDYGPEQRPSATFEVINSGRTPARILKFGATMIHRYVGSPLERPMPENELNLVEMDFHMVHGQHSDHGVTFEPVDVEQFKCAMNRTCVMYIFGRVVYRDRFQKWGSRYANFTFEMEHRKRIIDDPGEGPIIGFNIANKAYNDAD